MNLLFSTQPDAVVGILRIALALLLFPHGAQHFAGWFGGYGYSGTHQWMTQTLGFPSILSAAAIVFEFFGPIALLLGAGGRLMSLGIIVLMLGAIKTHATNGFFMNWFGSLPSGQEGYEYHLLMIVAALVIVAKGSGAVSVDRLLSLR